MALGAVAGELAVNHLERDVPAERHLAREEHLPERPFTELGDDLEVADPTQGDSYDIDTVNVSNFVNRSYFGLDGASPNTNYLRLALAPFGVRPGGYFQYEDGSGAHQILGKSVTQGQLAAKALMKDCRRNQRRKDRLLHNAAEKLPARAVGRSLREVLATNAALRHKVHQAAALAAYNVIKDAGKHLIELTKQSLSNRPPALESTQKALDAVNDLVS